MDHVSKHRSPGQGDSGVDLSRMVGSRVVVTDDNEGSCALCKAGGSREKKSHLPEGRWGHRRPGVGQGEADT